MVIAADATLAQSGKVPGWARVGSGGSQVAVWLGFTGIVGGSSCEPMSGLP